METRACSAYRELSGAWLFEHVIPNHGGEDSDDWEAFYYLIGDARKANGNFGNPDIASEHSALCTYVYCCLVSTAPKTH